MASRKLSFWGWEAVAGWVPTPFAIGAHAGSVIDSSGQRRDTAQEGETGRASHNRQRNPGGSGSSMCGTAVTDPEPDPGANRPHRIPAAPSGESFRDGEIKPAAGSTLKGFRE